MHLSGIVSNGTQRVQIAQINASIYFDYIFFQTCNKL
ncbi:hypothetical protein GNIT_2549 [Glaciecola nitratireducens FR1064]|uniref:Uncharacterized protein n=1 Tax=Glaciecola nitratireducens (strain JCM 12485 / KCTC 12276 / FR1064) TaxID=1085623 RepID=G4QM75_GLANF|nr:hypothetical protein GNIT_2549 [Glaciecola nitratireducens FR1064]